MTLIKYRGLTALLTASAIVFIPVSNRSFASDLDNFNKVENGMSRGRVETLLGKESEETSSTVDIDNSDPRISLIVTPKYVLGYETMPEKVATDIAALPDVVDTCPVLVSSCPTEELGHDPIAIESWPANNHRFAELKPIKGAILSEQNLGQRAAIIGQDLAKARSVKVGDTLTLNDEKINVTGIFASKLASENSKVVMLLPDAQKLFGRTGKITGCTVMLKDTSRKNRNKVATIIETDIATANGLAYKLNAAPPDQYFLCSAKAKMSMVCWKDETQVICIAFINGKVAMKTSVRR